jgi:hypothetical protein
MMDVLARGINDLIKKTCDAEKCDPTLLKAVIAGALINSITRHLSAEEAAEFLLDFSTKSMEIHGDERAREVLRKSAH